MIDGQWLALSDSSLILASARATTPLNGTSAIVICLVRCPWLRAVNADSWRVRSVRVAAGFVWRWRAPEVTLQIHAGRRAVASAGECPSGAHLVERRRFIGAWTALRVLAHRSTESYAPARRRLRWSRSGSTRQELARCLPGR